MKETKAMRPAERRSRDPGMALALGLGLVALAACSRAGNAAEQRDVPQVRAPASAAQAAVAPSAGTAAPASQGKAFGVTCVDGAECASGVCFHKRIKGADAGPERRGVHPEAEEHEGFCSMKCDSDGDCPVPPTRGKCGARGMCK